MMLRSPPESNKTVRLQIKALAGLLVDTSKSLGDNVQVFVCVTRKNELQSISTPSNPLTLAASEKRWGRNRRSVRRHVAVWSADNIFVLENVTAAQLFELHVIAKEGPSRSPEWMGACQWSLTAGAKGAVDLFLTPCSQQSSSAVSIDTRRHAMLRMEIAADESPFPTLIHSPQIKSMSLSATQQDILNVYNSTRTKDDASKSSRRKDRPTKMRAGGWRWRERDTKKELRQKRSWWQKLSLGAKRNMDYGYQLGDDDTRIEGEDLGRNMGQNKATKEKPIESSSAKMSRPESPWDPFGIMSMNKCTGSITRVTKVGSDDVNDLQRGIRTPPSAAADDGTLCYSVASESGHPTSPKTLLLKKAHEIYDVPDPGLLILSDDDTHNPIEATFGEQANDDEIEMAFEADSGILVLSNSSRVRHVESPRGLAHLFNCWESQFEQHPHDEARRDDEAATVVFDSSSAGNSSEGTTKQLRNDTSKRELPPMKVSDELVARTASSQTANSNKRTKMPRKKWTMIDTFSEGITDWLRCGPSLLEKKKMRAKKIQESDANLLGIFVKRNVEDAPLHYLPEYRSPSSVTMSDVMQ